MQRRLGFCRRGRSCLCLPNPTKIPHRLGTGGAVLQVRVAKTTEGMSAGLANLRVLEATEIKTVPYLPLSHPFVEWLIGTRRRWPPDFSNSPPTAPEMRCPSRTPGRPHACVDTFASERGERPIRCCTSENCRLCVANRNG